MAIRRIRILDKPKRRLDPEEIARKLGGKLCDPPPRFRHLVGFMAPAPRKDKDRAMSLRTRLVLRILWILLGIAAVVCGVVVTISGFSGNLVPALAGFGWLILTFHMAFSVLGDIAKAAGTALDIRNGGE